MSTQTGSLGRSSSPFDFNSQAGVMLLLASIRASDLSNVQKNELRDLVFLYSNGGGDATVRLSLEQKIATYKLVPVSLKGKAPTQAAGASATTPLRPFGVARPAPTFVPVAITQPAAPVAPTPTPTPTPTPVPVLAPADVPAQNNPTPPTRAIPPPESITRTLPEPVSVAAPQPGPAVATPPEPVPAAVPVAPPLVNTPVPTPVVAPQPTPHIERIREIKQLVNQKVGNPVNLVDINNDVGREYMMALLEAMKKVGGGLPGELDAAMLRLEAAYVAVEQAIAAHGAASSTAAPTAEAPVPSVPIPAPAPIPVPVVEVAPPEVSEAARPAPAPQAPPVIPSPEPVFPPPEAAQKPRSITPRAGAMAGAPIGYAAASLAEDPAPLLTPNDLPDPALVQASGEKMGDPLHTREVDAGLEQLLAEWSIFKKSGLFGTGPKGREHPLFKELSKLSIPLILAGRYSEPSQEVRQSVTDYVNGWRYEQGIVYEQDETLEHYLRRVIRHIIDLQKRRA